MRLFEFTQPIDEVGKFIHHDMQLNGDAYYGKNIVWMGESGKMVKLTQTNSSPILGNIFYHDKLEDMTESIKESESKIVFNSPRVNLVLIDITRIKENFEAMMHGDLDIDPVINNYHEYTTGNSRLDQYIVDPEQYLDDEARGDDEYRIELQHEMEELLKDAIEYEDGDNTTPTLAKYKSVYVVIDGNHRVAKAFQDGLPTIKARVVDIENK